MLAEALRRMVLGSLADALRRLSPADELSDLPGAHLFLQTDSGGTISTGSAPPPAPPLQVPRQRPALRVELLLRESPEAGAPAVVFDPPLEAFAEAVAALQLRALAAAEGAPRLLLDATLKPLLEAPRGSGDAEDGGGDDGDPLQAALAGGELEALGARLIEAAREVLAAAAAHAAVVGRTAGEIAAGEEPGGGGGAAATRGELEAAAAAGALAPDDLRRRLQRNEEQLRWIKSLPAVK